MGEKRLTALKKQHKCERTAGTAEDAADSNTENEKKSTAQLDGSGSYGVAGKAAILNTEGVELSEHF